ncbi:flagellar motor switch protein FliY [Campylobacter sp. 19-13652]|uniref:flagellar motor switch protein FliY n=1 Tax=Campylobacter sp. 19-13652 TaxID=2840180 RepID=UPI001C862544|nr:flagellar motor switch protein FliY [Campylobacter sp. 19-13652]
MMKEFFNLFTQETKAVIEGLIGHAPKVGEANEYEAQSQTAINAPAVVANISVNQNAKMVFILPALLASGLFDLMLGEEELSGKEDIGDDELDSSKEITSNILGALSTTLGAQKHLPKLAFDIAGISFVAPDSAIELNSFSKLYSFSLEIPDIISSQIAIAVDSAFLAILGLGDESAEEASASAGASANNLSAEEIRNIGLIMDVRLAIRVRIGSKSMLLKDVLSMDIGSVIELNQLANDPLEILIGDKVVAMGEVVIVDGNFGIQITQIGSKKERLEQLR